MHYINSDRAVYSDLNPRDGGQSLYPMCTVFYVAEKNLVSGKTCLLDQLQAFQNGVHGPAAVAAAAIQVNAASNKPTVVTPSGEVVTSPNPPPPPPVTSHGGGHETRRISFVINNTDGDNESITSSQTTLAVQVHNASLFWGK